MNTTTTQTPIDMSKFSAQRVLDGIALAALVLLMGTIYTGMIVARLLRGQPVFDEPFDRPAQHLRHPLR